jgi:hypothetical protein
MARISSLNVFGGFCGGVITEQDFGFVPTGFIWIPLKIFSRCGLGVLSIWAGKKLHNLSTSDHPKNQIVTIVLFLY